nr:MFS transporter [Acinetobacter baumannii]
MNQSNIAVERTQKKTNAYAWYVVILCMLAYIFSFIDRQILALMIEPIKADLQLSDTQFSLLHGLAFSLFYAVMGLPLAYIADRFSRPKLISIGIIVWSLATATCGLSKNFIQLFLSRMAVGVGAFLGGGIAFLVGGYVINLLKGVTLIEVPLLGALKAWQIAFLVVGLPGIIIGLLFILTVKDPARKGQQLNQSGQVDQVKFTQCLQFIKKHAKTFACHYLGFTFYAMALYSLTSWTPAFYIRKFQLAPTETGYMLGTILLVANTLGVFCAGWLNDWFIKKGRQDAPMFTGVIGIVGLIIPIAFFTQTDQLWLSVTLLIPAMFFASFPLVISATALQMLAPNQFRARLSALFLLVSNLIGLGVGTTLVAIITDKFFGNPLMVGSSLSIVGGLSCVLALALLFKGCKSFSESMKLEKLH